uniref:Unkown protein n=1 Tax=Riptortus pedestris TaxID=329032 RepID=R4WD51_RIPPE|nr:unkown protein [Riptortus pedestris]
MKRLPMLALVAVCIAEISAGIASSCQSGGDLAIVPDLADRSSYFVCMNGRSERFQCPPGFYFDTKKPACTPKRVARFRRSPLISKRAKRSFLTSDGFLLGLLQDAQAIKRLTGRIDNQLQ